MTIVSDFEGAYVGHSLKLHEPLNDLRRTSSASASVKPSFTSERPKLEEFVIEEYEANNSLLDSELPTQIQFENCTVLLENKNIFVNNKLKLQMLTAMLSLLLHGLTDQILGSLVEYFLSYYKIDRFQVSILFIAQFCGYVPSSLLNNYLMSKLGLHFLYSTACIFSLFSCALYLFKAPYFILPFAAAVLGWVNGVFDCCLNYFVGNLEYSNQLLGLMHSMYGTGCLITPVLSIYLIKRGMDWSHYYLIAVVLSFVNFLMVYFLFKDETSHKYNYTAYETRNQSQMESPIDEVDGFKLENSNEPTIIETLTNKYVMFYCLVLFIYVGAELSVGIWLNNYLFRIKHLTEEFSSQMVSLFWLFMTLGRGVMGFYTGRYHENKEIKAVVVYCFLVALGCFFFWVFQSSVLIQGFSICFAAWFVGPLFGTTIIISLKTLPKKYSLHGISLIAGLGGAGAAIIPGIMGWISEHLGSSKDQNGHSDGAGLYFFPELVFFTFSLAASLWFGFYIYNKETFDKNVRLK